MMLDFINNNGVLFSGIFAILAALATSILTIVKDKKRAKEKTISSLKEALIEANREIEQIRTWERAEDNIDKSEGSIYAETLSNGKRRDICGFCWEREHIKIPIVRSVEYDDYAKKYYYSAYCNNCRANCVANYENNIDEGLPF